MKPSAAFPVSFLLLVTILLFPVASWGGGNLQKASLALQWLPQAQFAGFFVAEDKGFYIEAGLDVTLLSGGPDIVASDVLDSRKADFCTMFLSTAMERADTGMPLVNVGQLVRHSALMLLTRTDSGIRSIEDLHHRKVAMWANEFQVQPRALFRDHGIEVVVVPLGFSLDLFLRNAVAATMGMWYNEYHTLLSAGLREDELQPFFFRDTDYDFPEDGIYCLRRTAEERPEVVRALVNATMQGWEYAFAHEEEALDIVGQRMSEAGLPVNRVHQRWMLRRMRDLMTLEGSGLSPALDREVYERVGLTLERVGFIHAAPEYDDFVRGVAHAD
ncbi:MAG: ABC transporter substrate-binding protein [Desulfovibrionaceae bacterium]